ncbi:MAG: hypothetical protein ACKVQK_06385 [Burkholderiales bacterium]
MLNSIHTNHPRSETSPYLLQHVHNPVDWYLLSYSTTSPTPSRLSRLLAIAGHHDSANAEECEPKSTTGTARG